MMYESIVLLTGLRIYGTAYLTGLSQLTRLTHLKTDLINFGRIRKLYMTFELNWKEPEVVVKYSLIRYYAALLSRRGRILRRTLSVCPSVRPSRYGTSRRAT